jgi:GNAT superfamily N-acetyltransferase
VLSETRSVALRDGDAVVVEVHAPPYDPGVAREVARLLQEAFGSAEFGVRRLLGELPDYERGSRDYLFLVRTGRDGAIVGTSWYGVSAANPRLGLLGDVLAVPGDRRRGIGTIATAANLEHFAARGGEAMYLGTVNPEALRIYEKLGFATYSGLVKRALMGRAAADPDGFDRAYFRADGPTRVRPVHWGDHAGLSALYFAPRDAALLDAPTSKYASWVAPQPSCVGFYPPLRDSTVGRGGALGVLETADGRILGAVALHRRIPPPEGRRAILDYCLASAAADRAVQLLGYGLAEAERLGVRLTAEVCERDELKASALRDAGFRVVATIPDAFVIEETSYRRVVLAR